MSWGELMELLLSIAESARRLGIGKTRFFELLKAEELHAVRLGGRTLIPVVELERFVAALPPRGGLVNTVTMASAGRKHDCGNDALSTKQMKRLSTRPSKQAPMWQRDGGR
jgi:excisionase family DNA binding protein